MCNVPGCDREPKPPRKMCERCRGRQRRHGDPTVIKVKHGPEALVERWWDKVDQRGPDECWLWTGAKFNVSPNYQRSVFAINRKTVGSVRAGWFLIHGEWPPRHLEVCHTCDNGLCHNPAHWWLGTHAQNQADMVAKRRQKPRLLDVEQMMAIRARYLPYWTTAKMLAKEFGVSESLIRNVIAGTARPKVNK